MRRLVADGAFEEAGRRFAEFRCGLDRHIEMEERILFPAFERATGVTEGGPTAVMRSEHVDIQRHMQEAAAAISETRVDRFEAAARALSDVLGEHNVKEEQILYPTVDERIGGDRERDDLVRSMQAV